MLVCVCVNSLFLSMAEWYSVSTDTLQFVYPLTCWWTFGAITDTGVLNIHVHTFA